MTTEKLEIQEVQKNLTLSEKELSLVLEKKFDLKMKISALDMRVEKVAESVKSTTKGHAGALKRELECVINNRRLLMAEVRALGLQAEKELNRKLMVLGDAESREAELMRTLQQKEDLEEELAGLGDDQDPGMRLLSQQHKLEDKLKLLNAKHQTAQQEVGTLREELDENIGSLKRTETEMRSIKSRINAGLKLREERMKRIKRDLEILLEVFSNAFSMEGIQEKGLDRFIKDVVRSIGKGIEIDVLREQLSTVQLEESAIKTSYETKLQELRRSIRDQGFKQYFGEGDQELDSSLAKFTVVYEKKLSSLLDWKKSLKKMLEQNLVEDDKNQIYQLFLNKLLHRYIQKELTKRMDWSEAHQDRLDKLIALLEAYAQTAGSKGKEFLEEKRLMEQADIRIIELGCRKELIGYMAKVSGEQLENLTQERDYISSELEEVRSLFEAHVSGAVSEKLELAEEELIDEYKKIHRTYGHKVLDRKKLEVKTEVLSAVVEEKTRQLNRIGHLKEQIANYEIRIRQLQSSIKDELSLEISKISKRIEEIEAGQKGLCERDQDLLANEEALVNQLNVIELKESSLIGQKLEGMKDIQDQKSFLTQEIQAADKICSDLESKIHQLKSQMKSYFDKAESVRHRKKSKEEDIKKLMLQRQELTSRQTIASKHDKENTRIISKNKIVEEEQEVSNHFLSPTTDNLFVNFSKLKNSSKSSQKGGNVLNGGVGKNSSRDGKDIKVAEFYPESKPQELSIAGKKTVGFSSTGDVLETILSVKTTKPNETSSEYLHQSAQDNYNSSETQPCGILKTNHKRITSTFTTRTTQVEEPKIITSSSIDHGPRESSIRNTKSRPQIKTPGQLKLDEILGPRIPKTAKAAESRTKYFAPSNYRSSAMITQQDNKSRTSSQDQNYSSLLVNRGSSKDVKQQVSLNADQCNNSLSLVNKLLNRSRERVASNLSALSQTGIHRNALQQNFENNIIRRELNSNRIDSLFSKADKLASSRPGLNPLGIRAIRSSKLTLQEGLLNDSSNKENRRPKQTSSISQLFRDHSIGSGKGDNSSSTLQVKLLNKRGSKDSLNSHGTDMGSGLINGIANFGREQNTSVDSIKRGAVKIRDCGDPSECKKHNKYFRLENASKATLEETELFRNIRQLLEGTQIYKRFPTSQLKKAHFDPKRSLEKPPELCGYGLRFVRLNLNKKCLEILSVQKSSVEKAIGIGSILQVCTKQVDQLRREGELEGLEHLPFTILAKDGSAELISLSSGDFSTWVKGLNLVINRSKELARLSSKVKVFCV